MKLSALAAQIKSCGHCEVINNGGRIFVGTGSAFYCMDGYPRTQDAGELGAMLGIPQKKMKKHLLSRGMHNRREIVRRKVGRRTGT